MTKVTIVPEQPGVKNTSFRASTRDRESVGSSPGAALDAITGQLNEAEAGTIVVVQNLRPDEFFSAAQQQRLAQLMGEWRVARDRGLRLNSTDQGELEKLVDAELDASAKRADAVSKELLS